MFGKGSPRMYSGRLPVALSIGDLCSSSTRCSAFHLVASSNPSSHAHFEFGKSTSLFMYSPFLKCLWISGGRRSFTSSAFDASIIVPGSTAATLAAGTRLSANPRARPTTLLCIDEALLPARSSARGAHARHPGFLGRRLRADALPLLGVFDREARLEEGDHRRDEHERAHQEEAEEQHQQERHIGLELPGAEHPEDDARGERDARGEQRLPGGVEPAAGGYVQALARAQLLDAARERAL